MKHADGCGHHQERRFALTGSHHDFCGLHGSIDMDGHIGHPAPLDLRRCGVSRWCRGRRHDPPTACIDLYRARGFALEQTPDRFIDGHAPVHAFDHHCSEALIGNAARAAGLLTQLHDRITKLASANVDGAVIAGLRALRCGNGGNDAQQISGVLHCPPLESTRR